MSILTENFDKDIHPNEIRTRLYQLETKAEDMQRTMTLLMDMVGLLARAENHRIDRAKAKK